MSTWPIHTLHQLQTRNNADSIEFIPDYDQSNSDPLTRVFVAGNYQLNEQTREKIGRIYLYQLQEEQTSAVGASPSVAVAVDSSSSSTPTESSTTPAPAKTISSSVLRLVEQQVIDTDAIFDLKWSPRLLDNKMLLGQADASGKLLLYEYKVPNSGPNSASASASASLTELYSQDVVSGASCLSLDWNNRLHVESNPLIAISQSNSHISLWQLSSEGLSAQRSWLAHEYEMWIVSFNAHTPHILYSGADDCKFKGWDLRAPTPGPRAAIFTDSTHEMGVCSIQSHPTREHVLATGSYDEQLRIWDTRSMREPTITHSVGGGCWRVRWNPTAEEKRRDSILCCAMHNGFAVVQLAFDDSAQVEDAMKQVQIAEKEEAAASSSAPAATTSTASASLDATITVDAKTVVEYKLHASLAYGADWCYRKLPQELTSAIRNADTAAQSTADQSNADSKTSVDSDLIATCSFYDKQLNVWTTEPIHSSS